MKEKLKKIQRARIKLEALVRDLEHEIQAYVEFETFILWQPSDGYVLSYDMKNAPLDACMHIIERKGVLTMEDYNSICI